MTPQKVFFPRSKKTFMFIKTSLFNIKNNDQDPVSNYCYCSEEYCSVFYQGFTMNLKD